jgi:hypothetical protein
MMMGDGMRTGAEMPSGYVPKSMPGNPSRPMQMGTMDTPKNSQYRANYRMQTGAYSAPKSVKMRGPQCHERGVQY